MEKNFYPKFGWNILIELCWRTDGREIARINFETLDRNCFVQPREIRIANLIKEGAAALYTVAAQKKNTFNEVAREREIGFAVGV